VSADFLWTMLAKVKKDNAQREFYLTDLAEAAAALAAPAVSVTVSFDEVSGVNDRVDLARVGASMRGRINHRHLIAGVSISDPASTHIDDTARIGADSSLSPSVAVRGSSVLGKRVSVGVGCVITDSVIADDVTLRPYCVVEGAQIAAGSLVGPFARLRPGTALAPGVHIGNFVETKNAKIGPGTKANHLSYLGDAVIGRGVNVGAGTITCNYDGVNKHLTQLGDRVFVGSDTQFVAPVSVGRDAYIAAGSTIVEDVPAGALGIARGRQAVKAGWARRHRGAQARSKAGKRRGKSRS